MRKGKIDESSIQVEKSNEQQPPMQHKNNPAIRSEFPSVELQA
jgi:hypothetical protein